MGALKQLSCPTFHLQKGFQGSRSDLLFFVLKATRTRNLLLIIISPAVHILPPPIVHCQNEVFQHFTEIAQRTRKTGRGKEVATIESSLTPFSLALPPPPKRGKFLFTCFEVWFRHFPVDAGR